MIETNTEQKKIKTIKLIAHAISFIVLCFWFLPTNFRNLITYLEIFNLI